MNYQKLNPHSLTLYLIYMLLELYNNRTKAATLGENGLRYAAENFNRDKIAQEFYDHLAQL